MKLAGREEGREIKGARGDGLSIRTDPVYGPERGTGRRCLCRRGGIVGTRISRGGGKKKCRRRRDGDASRRKEKRGD